MVDYFIFLLQWFHVFFTVLLLGSGFFFEFFVKPKLQSLSPPDSGKITMAIADNFTVLVYVSWAVIIASGYYRAFIYTNTPPTSLFDTEYGRTLFLKMIVVGITLIFSLLITYTAMEMKKAEPKDIPTLVKRLGILSKSITILGAVIVFFAVALREGVYFI